MSNNNTWNEEINLLARLDRLEQDIVVLEEVNTVPILNTEYHTHYYYIGMCLSGRTIGKYNYQDTDFKAGDICWIMPDNVISHSYVSDDYRVLSVYISKELYKTFMERGTLGKFHYPMRAVIISLNPEQFQAMADSFRLMSKFAQLDHPQRLDILSSMCHILATLGDEFINQKHPEYPKKMSKNEELFEQFYQSLVNNYRKSHEVAFYAREACLTPKYFATVIKNATGIAASEWINRYIIVEAKWLLRKQYTIKQVAHYLGFSEQASFSRFFKMHTGMTATEFREQL